MFSEVVFVHLCRGWWRLNGLLLGRSVFAKVKVDIDLDRWLGGTLLLLCLLCLAWGIWPLATLALLRRELPLLVTRLLKIVIWLLAASHAPNLVFAHGSEDSRLSWVRRRSLRPTLLRNLTSLLGSQMVYTIFAAIRASSRMQSSLARLLTVDFPRWSSVYDHTCLLETSLQLFRHLKSTWAWCFCNF